MEGVSLLEILIWEGVSLLEILIWVHYKGMWIKNLPYMSYSPTPNLDRENQDIGHNLKARYDNKIRISYTK
jgi:hypothetical protein